MKKSLLKTCAALMLLGIMPFNAACGKKAVDDENTLEIFVLDAGYGTAWAEQIAESFKNEDWVKEKYPALKVEKPRTSDQKALAQSYMSAPKTNNFDILFGQQLQSYFGTTEIVNITQSVYNAKVPGENVLFKDKMNSSVRENFEYKDITGSGMDGYYAVPWQGGYAGILYNEDVLKANGVEVPRTTDEFIAACEKITANNKDKSDSDATKSYAIIQSSEAPYWDMYYFCIPWAQYDGVKGYENFYNGIYEDEDGAVYSNKIFQTKGRLRALEFFEEVMDYDKGFISPRSFSDTFMIAQAAFLKGAAAFHVNGDYFTREMYDTYNRMPEADRDTINIMRSPVLSSILEVLPDKSVENDEELSALIKAIDEENPAVEGDGYKVTQADYDRVKDARFTVSCGATVQGIIPSYAKAKDVAIDFLRYMATDKALNIYIKATNGCALDFDYDVKTQDPELYNSLQPLNKTKIDYFSAGNAKVKLLKSKYAFPLYIYANLTPFAETTYWTTLTAKGNTKTAQTYYEETIKLWTDAKFKQALGLAGLQ